jgi:inner membrane protein
MNDPGDLWLALGAWRWLILGLAFLGIELATGTTWFLWLAAAAGLTGLAVALPGDMPLAAELIAFAATAVALTVAGRRWIRPGWMGGGAAPLNEPHHRLVGSRVVASGDFAHGYGRVRVGDSEWRGKLEGASEVPAGTALDVTDVEGGTLHVRIAPAAAPLLASDGKP